MATNHPCRDRQGNSNDSDDSDDEEHGMDRIVSVRMPQALFDKLALLSHTQHYLDVSECLRSITRKRCLELAIPYSTELHALRTELSAALTHKEDASKKEQLLKDLRKIIGELEEGRS
jgi:hypothetical protein